MLFQYPPDVHASWFLSSFSNSFRFLFKFLFCQRTFSEERVRKSIFLIPSRRSQPTPLAERMRRKAAHLHLLGMLHTEGEASFVCISRSTSSMILNEGQQTHDEQSTEETATCRARCSENSLALIAILEINCTHVAEKSPIRTTGCATVRQYFSQLRKIASSR